MNITLSARKLSRGLNHRLGGREHYSLCAQLYADAVMKGGRWWLVSIVDFLDFTGKDHCLNAYLRSNKRRLDHGCVSC